MSQDIRQETSPEPIAVDLRYRLRDNQFWYGDCAFANIIRDQSTITVRIAGLGIRTLTHAALGRNGRSTRSFTLPSREDRLWWEQQRGDQVRVELLSVANERRQPPEEPARLTPSSPIQAIAPEQGLSQGLEDLDIGAAMLCIGLDVAWFGGSAKNKDSQYDCLASVFLPPEDQEPNLELCRVRLEDRDPEAIRLLERVDVLLHKYRETRQVVFALDAPIQATVREHLCERMPLPGKGMVKRRACDSFLSERRRAIDRQAGGANGWHPNIQPGAPLAPRVEQLLAGLVARGFDLWTPDRSFSKKLVIECFPAEAIWAMKRMREYPDAMTAEEAKAYKKQKGNLLTGKEVQSLVHDVLDSFGVSSVDNRRWISLVNAAIAWMINDETWQTDGLYKGGKLLDDVVDSMICLATSLSYMLRNAHVWLNPQYVEDGHIIGPGYQDDGRWFHSWPLEGTEDKR